VRFLPRLLCGEQGILVVPQRGEYPFLLTRPEGVQLLGDLAFGLAPAPIPRID
jgi:hypothetical protein